MAIHIHNDTCILNILCTCTGSVVVASVYLSATMKSATYVPCLNIKNEVPLWCFQAFVMWLLIKYSNVLVYLLITTAFLTS